MSSVKLVILIRSLLFFIFCKINWNAVDKVIDDMFKSSTHQQSQALIGYPTSASGILILLSNQEMLLGLTHIFILQERLEDNFIPIISWAWYNTA